MKGQNSSFIDGVAQRNLSVPRRGGGAANESYKKTTGCLFWQPVHTRTVVRGLETARRTAVLHLLTHVFDILVEGLPLIVGQQRLELVALLLLQLAALRAHLLLIAAASAKRLQLLAIPGRNRIGLGLLGRGEGDVLEQHRCHVRAIAAALLLRILGARNARDSEEQCYRQHCQPDCLHSFSFEGRKGDSCRAFDRGNAVGWGAPEPTHRQLSRAVVAAL